MSRVSAGIFQGSKYWTVRVEGRVADKVGPLCGVNEAPGWRSEASCHARERLAAAAVRLNACNV
jgi:hypothetical protein